MAAPALPSGATVAFCGPVRPPSRLKKSRHRGAVAIVVGRLDHHSTHLCDSLAWPGDNVESDGAVSSRLSAHPVRGPATTTSLHNVPHPFFFCPHGLALQTAPTPTHPYPDRFVAMVSLTFFGSAVSSFRRCVSFHVSHSHTTLYYHCKNPSFFSRAVSVTRQASSRARSRPLPLPAGAKGADGG